jgi:hypothetical protein
MSIVCISSLYCILEFITKNFLSIDFDTYLYRPDVEELYASSTNLLYRARSFATEPGHFALYLELFAPLGIYYMIKSGYNNAFIIIYVLIVFTSLLLTFSSASFLIIIISFLFTFLFFLYNRKGLSLTLLKNILSFLILSFILFHILSLSDIFTFRDLILTFCAKLDNSSSLIDRISRIEILYKLISVTDIIKILFGHGPAAYSTYGLPSIISLYANIFFELGAIGLVLYFILSAYVLRIITKIKSNIKFYLFFSYICGLLHYCIISNYWYIWIWFLTTYVYFTYKNQKIY